jgi:hypothetical protein
MNAIERAECLLDAGSSGNMNFTVIVAYRGELQEQPLRQALAFLQAEHRLLRSSLQWSDQGCSFGDTTAAVPLRTLPYGGFEQWRQVAREDVRQRFADPALPLWRLSWLNGAGVGQLLLTFHHAIADGVCGMRLVDQLFSALEQLAQGQAPAPLGVVDVPHLPLDDLAGLSTMSAEPEAEPAPRQDRQLHTDYVLDHLDAAATAAVIAWARSQGIRVHSVLFATLLLAIRRVTGSDHPIVEANTVVNFRPFLQPELSSDVMRLTRICVVTPVPIEAIDDLTALAQFIHGDLYSRLEHGDHVRNVRRIMERVQRGESGADLWRRARIPEHQVILTNVGRIDWPGDYGTLSIERLFFIANVEPIFDSPDNWILGSLTYRDQLQLSLWYLEELVAEQTAIAVLAELRRLLTTLAGADQKPGCGL